MTAIYRDTTTHEQSGEDGWNNAGAAKVGVGCIELASIGSIQSITRQLPSWDGQLQISGKIAIDGPLSGNLSNCAFAFGICSGNARRFGQTATEYFLGASSTTRNATWVGTTYANTVPPNSNYLFTKSPQRNCLWNANSATTGGASGYGMAVPLVDGDFSDGDNVTHWNHSWLSFLFWARKSGATWWSGLEWHNYANIWSSRRCHRQLQDFTWGSSWHARQVMGMGGSLKSGVGVSASRSIGSTYAVDEGTYGAMDYLNIAWQEDNGHKMLVRDIQVSHSRNPSGAIYP